MGHNSLRPETAWTGLECRCDLIELAEISSLQDQAAIRMGNEITRTGDDICITRLPGMFWRTDSDWERTGGLMAYGANRAEQSRRAAYFVDKILKGAKPAELPVELPKSFELVINLKTAKEIGITIPPRVLAWADRVIK